MKTYAITLESDQGKHTIEVHAKSKQDAIELVLMLEKAPFRAIEKVTNTKGTK